MRSFMVTAVVAALHGMVLVPWGAAAPEVTPPETSVVRVSLVQGAAVKKPAPQQVAQMQPTLAKTPAKTSAKSPAKTPVVKQQPEPAPAQETTKPAPQQGNAASTAITKPAPADYASNPPPVYPREARLRKLQGVVYLEVWVNEDGSVKQLALHRSSGHKVLDEAAAKAVQQWRFSPARMGEKAVAGKVIVPIAFKLQ